VSALLILKSIMEKIRDNEGLDGVPLPHKYFNLIGGTSTGGYGSGHRFHVMDH
jgi:hypothetical protein